MKKTVVTLLLVLPFILIYFISFTGKILSTYKHIFVERVVVLDEDGDEYRSGDYIKLGLDEEFDLNIKIYPELATNKEVTISNNNKNACTVDMENMKITTHEYGISRLIITSKDRHFVQFIIFIHVTQEDIEDLEFLKPSIDVLLGRTYKVDSDTIRIIPHTVSTENRELVYTIEDEDIATVNELGEINGIREGSTTLTVSSKHKPEISKTITVNVLSSYPKGLHFIYDGSNNRYTSNTAEVDLKSLLIVSQLGVTIDDVIFDISGNNGIVDISRLDEGIITFNTEREYVGVTAFVYDTDSTPYESYMLIRFVNN